MELSHAINQYATLMTRLREIEKGVTFDAEREVQENQAEKEKAFLEDRISELNEMVEEFQEKYEKREFEINELKSNYEVQLTNLENNSEKLEEMKKLLIQKEEIESKLMEENELEKSRLIEIETEREQLRQVTSLLTQIVMDDNKLEQFRMKVQDSSPEFQSISSSDYAVGGIWTKEKGKKKLILSVKQRDLIDPVTDEPVNSIDSESRKKLAEQWLRIRPSGGRIFIDDQGNASTLLGENLIYLGNLKKG
jgi:chromosome segregation ATPase